MWRRTMDRSAREKKSLPTGPLLFICTLLLIASSLPALAETHPQTWSLTPYVGGFLFEGNQDLDHSPVYGLRLGYDFTRNWGGEALFGYVRTEYEANDSSVDVYNYRLEGLYHFLPESRWVPFLAVGVGGMSISGDDAVDKNRAAVDYGAGVKYALTDRWDLRADIRHVLAFGSTYNDLEYTLGVSFFFGGPKTTAAAAPGAEAPGQSGQPGPAGAVSEPIQLTAKAASDSRIDLDWSPAPGATGYKVYQDGSYLATTPATAMSDTGLKPDTRYCFVVTAVDGMGREYDRSNEACATTFAAGATGPGGGQAAMPPGQGQEGKAAPGMVGMAEGESPYTLEDIHFDFDKFNLKPEARAILKRHAEWLSANQHVELVIVVEGHCDERGTAEYNLALGQRRADAAARYLIDLGVDAKRITTISYGFERPLDPGHNEAAWAKNRRAHFVVSDEVKK